MAFFGSRIELSGCNKPLLNKHAYTCRNTNTREDRMKSNISKQAMNSLHAIAALFLPMLIFITTARAETPTSPTPVIPELIISWRAQPNDTVLRQRVITLARANHAHPSIPEAAQEALTRGDSLIQNQKEKPDDERAIEMYAQALNHAPWWEKAYRALARAQLHAGQYDNTVRTLQFYLQTVPADSEHARWAHEAISHSQKQRMYELEYEKHRRQDEDNFNIQDRFIFCPVIQ